VSDPAPTLDAIDRKLAFWEAQVARVKTNLDLLQQAPSVGYERSASCAVVRPSPHALRISRSLSEKRACS